MAPRREPHAHRSWAPRLGRLLPDPRARPPVDQAGLGRPGLVRGHLAALAAHPRRHRHRAHPAPDGVRRHRQRHRRADLRADHRRGAGDTDQRRHLVHPDRRDRRAERRRSPGRSRAARRRSRSPSRAPTSSSGPPPGADWTVATTGVGADEIDISADATSLRGRSRGRHRHLEPGQGRPGSRSSCRRSPEMGLDDRRLGGQRGRRPRRRAAVRAEHVRQRRRGHGPPGRGRHRQPVHLGQRRQRRHLAAGLAVRWLGQRQRRVAQPVRPGGHGDARHVELGARVRRRRTRLHAPG